MAPHDPSASDPITPHLAMARRFDRRRGRLGAHVARLERAAASCGCERHAPCGCRATTPCNETRAAPPCNETRADHGPPTADPPEQFPAQVGLTGESLGNVQRAPDGSSFFCVVEPAGDAHCALARGAAPVDDAQKSEIKGARLEPLFPNRNGTGHQQLAKAAGITFDEASAQVGHVEGEGYGFSIYKEDDCGRDYGFQSAFNRKLNPNGDRALPPAQQQQLRAQVEAIFPPCDVADADDHTPP